MRPQASGKVEEAGLISELGAWVLIRACHDLTALGTPRGSPDLWLNVNASGRQLVDGSLVPAVASVLEATGLAPARLTIELTESALLADMAAAIRSARRLQELGVGIALDDFGTGASSLSLLKQIPGIVAISPGAFAHTALR